MSDVIRLLPDSVANQIAAGEVIQRPASVIKELVENAVDAGATDIRIIIKDAGRTLIQVVDNGKGMSETDARMAFERHATSKIKAADDLFSLHTMGFRGEALPSICAISQVELKTRTDENQLGTRLLINASRVEEQEPCVCDRGTNIMVKNLFFNVPARRKFLKSDSVETSNVLREFERLALVNNHIRMTLDIGNRSYDLRAGTFKQRIGDLWKNNLDLHLVPIDVDTSLVKITGFISRPEYARRRNPLQFLIVNGRNMRHPYFHKAILNCYDALIAPDTQPCYFMKFEVDPASIDVNIHPTKNEIKFEYEQEIWPILQASVKAALGKFGAVPSIDFSSDVLPVDPLRGDEKPVKPELDLAEGYNPFADAGGYKSEGFGRLSSQVTQGFEGKRRHEDVPRNWDSLYADFMHGARGFGQTSAPKSDPATAMPGKTGDIRVAPSDASDEEPACLPHIGEESSSVGILCVQHALKYIVTTSREGLIIIDQHRAHVKILYEQYLRKILDGDCVSQGVMFPETISLDPAQQAVLSDIGDSLSQLGFSIEYQEAAEWKITGVPAMVKNADMRDLVMRLLESVSDGDNNYGREGDVAFGLRQKVALAMARASAIRRGVRLTPDEMDHMVGELFSLPDPAYTPNGNAVYMLLDDRRIESLFRP